MGKKLRVRTELMATLARCVCAGFIAAAGCAVDESGLGSVEAPPSAVTPTASVPSPNGNSPTPDLSSSTTPQVNGSPTTVPTGAQCDPNRCDGRRCSGTTCSRYAHCRELHAQAPALRSGVYEIDPDGADGAAPFRAYCDMESEGGGWTLLMKLDGRRPTFRYASPLWTNGETLSPDKPDFDTQEAKLAGYATLPFTQLRIGMADTARAQSTLRFATAQATSTSLAALFGQEVNTPLALDRGQWTPLVKDTQLQTLCNRSAVNANGGEIKLRLGLIANNEDNCDTPDSWIGIGAGDGYCQQSTSVGAQTCFAGFVPLVVPNVARSLGYLFVR